MTFADWRRRWLFCMVRRPLKGPSWTRYQVVPCLLVWVFILGSSPISASCALRLSASFWFLNEPAWRMYS